MKRLTAVTLALGLLVGACAPDRSGFGESEGAPIDDAIVSAAVGASIQTCPTDAGVGELSDIDLVCVATGAPVDLGAFDGPVVVNVWANWCEPCREELPLLARAAQEYAGRVTFVGVLFADQDPLAAIELAQASGVTYPQVADPGSDLRVPLSLRGLPTTVFLIDGEVVGTQQTPYADYGVLVADLAEHLDVQL